MTRAFNVIIERDAEGYHVASAPELRAVMPKLTRWIT